GVPRTAGANALPRLFGRTHVGEQQVLDTRADGSHRQVTASILLDLDHPAEVWEELDRPPQVVQIVHRPGRVFGNELDVVPVASLSDELGHGRPAAQEMRAQTGLASAQK